MAERIERRLAAILSADVVGYSRLMEADESATLAKLRAHRQEVFDPLVAQHRGRVVKLMGDGALVEFASVVDAVACAVAVQTALAARNEALPLDECIVLRVGVNLGDVMIEGGDLYGDGVNVAARLQALAEPGSVYVSGDVHRQVQRKLDLTFEDHGTHNLKNIDEPVHVWRWSPERAAGEGAHTPAAEPSAPDRPSIAVLPFDNMSADAEQDYFADGITEDIITDLSKVSGLFVIARNSVFTYKGRAVRIDQACRELGVRYAVEGSVRKAGNRVRVTAQLIDGTDGGHVWAERYDRDLDDIFAVQDDLSRNIVEALKVTLTAGEAARLVQRGTANIEAYDCFLRARELMVRFTKTDNTEARQLLRKALALDPGYAVALAALANSYLQEWTMGRSASPEETLERACELARGAVALDDNLAEAHSVLGFALLWKKDHAGALAEGAKGVALDPNAAFARYFHSMTLSYSGRPDEGLSEARLAARLDPSNEGALVFAAGHALYMLGDYVDALAAFDEMIRHAPGFMPAYIYAAICHEKLGQNGPAREALQSALAKTPSLSAGWARDALPYESAAALDDFTATAQAIGLPE